MKIGPINIYKKGGFSLDATSYYFYHLIVRPYYQPAQKYVTITIVVEYTAEGIFSKIHTHYVEMEDEHHDIPELFEYSDLQNDYMRTKYNLQPAPNIRIPIMKLIKSKWGDNYVENIFDHIYTDLGGWISYSTSMITKEIVNPNISFSHVYADEVLIIYDYQDTSEDVKLYQQIIRWIRRKKKLEKISNRISSQ